MVILHFQDYAVPEIKAAFLNLIVNVPDKLLTTIIAFTLKLPLEDFKEQALLTLWLAELVRYRNSVFVFAAPIVRYA
ncbi:hypothetical protein [Paenibacillus sp. FSL L8-0689]|uniref:hypothetical protein n=1 Tax=Paenibacillus sp. FSL L8-0689 TaxID=2921607 RepID=UPI0030F92722